MANTYVDYTAVASQTDYNFSFEYLRDDHVKVKVNDVIVTNYTIVTSPVQLIRFNTAPSAGATIKIYRDSRGDFSPLVDFVNGSVLTESELDESYKHNLFVSQESSEGTGGEQLTKKGLANYDAEGNKIINLGTPTASTDAANKGYVDQTIDNSIALGGSPAIVSLGGYDVTSSNSTLKQLTAWTADIETGDKSNTTVTTTGTTIARTLADRFADAVNVLDHIPSNLHADILDGSNTTDLTSYFNAAITEATGSNRRAVYVPAGIYKLSPLDELPIGTVIFGPEFNTGGINRLGAARLQFKSLTAGQKALQVTKTVKLINLSIEGENSTRLGYGVYGGLDRTEDLGQYIDLINCRIEFFDIAIQLSQILNHIDGCAITQSNTGIVLNDISNGTVITNCLIINLSPAGGKGIIVNDGDSIRIVNNTFESIPLHVEVNGGKITNITGNRFEAANTGFIDVQGSTTVADNHYLHVNINDNFFEEYGASASSSNRYAIQVVRGFCSIENNQIREYDSVTDEGLKFGIRWAMPSDGSFKGCYIGYNSIGAHVPIQSTVVDLINRRLIQTPFSQSFDATYTVSGDVLNTDFFNIASPEGDDKRALFIRQVKLFVIDAVDTGDVGISIGKHASTDIPGDYIVGVNLGSGNLTEGSEVLAEQADYATNGNSIGVFSDRAFQIGRFYSGSPTTGRVGVTIELGLIRYRDLSE